MEIPRRGGSDNYGISYEHTLTALFSIRFSLLENLDKFWIASNVDHVGDFDDIVMSIKSKDGASISFLIQLKHKETEKLLQAGDFTYKREEQEGKRKKQKETFSIEKYWNGFEAFQKKYNKNEEDGDLEFIKELRKVDKIILILYTNKGVDDCNFLQKSDLNDNFLDLLDTNEIQHCYGFDHNQLNYDCNFLQKMRLFASQIHASEVGKLIEDELKKILKLSFPIMINFSEVVEKYVKFVETWIKGYRIGDETKYYTLTKGDVRRTLVGILFDSYKYDFSKTKFSSYNNPEKLIWNQLMKDRDVTVINFSEKAVKFLLEYFGSEIIRVVKKAPRMWGEALAEKQQERFYNKFGHAQVAQVCQNSDLSPLLTYKYLWTSGKLPLLLQINDGKNFGDVLEILSVSNLSVKVIVLVKDSVVSIPKNFVNSFASLQDLSDESLKQILNLKVQFQGRVCVHLKDIVDESMFGNLKCHDLIDIVSNDFNIGNKFSVIFEYFISRSLSKILLNADVLSLQKETFVIETNDVKATEEKLKEFIPKKSKVYFVSRDGDAVRKKMKSAKRAVHRLKYQNDCLEWKESLGDISSLLSHQIETHEGIYRSIEQENVEKIVTNNLMNQIRVISGCPGMGKTIFLDFLALNAPWNFWVIKIKLTDLTVKKLNIYKPDKEDSKASIKALDSPSDIFKFFQNVIAEDSEIQNLPLSLGVFNKFLKSKKLLILLDGFDETSILYKDEVTDVIKFLQKKDFPIWITTREHMQGHLEKTFKVFATRLKPFTEKEQKTFLTTYFKASIPNSNEAMVEQFVERLLKASKKNLSDRDGHFTGIPLQTKLLADAFLKDCKKSLESNEIRLNERFDLLYLYKEFVEQKTDILCEKFGESERTWRKTIERVQVLFALKCVFSSFTLNDFGIDEELARNFEEVQSQFVQREGILVVQINKNKELVVNFVHQTFAEYLVATFLARNYSSDNEQTKNMVLHLIEQRCIDTDAGYDKFLFLIFDRIVAKTSPFHLDVVNLNFDDIKSQVEDDPNVLLETDDFERTGLHILALYGTEFQNCNLMDVFEKIENFDSSDLEVVDMLNYNALDYCFCSRTWTLANVLCKTAPLLNFRIFDIVYDVENFQFIFRTIFHNYLMRDLLIGDIREDTLIYDYCKQLSTYLQLNLNSWEFKKQLNVATVSEYLKEVGLKCSESGTYNDVRFAISFGSKTNVEELFASTEVDVNERDNSNRHTLLHYAVYGHRLDLFDFLLEEGADVNIPGRNADTAIHLAAVRGIEYVIEKTINKIENINVKNDSRLSPLDCALRFNHLKIAKILMSNGAILDKRNSPYLHYAAEAGDNELLLMLLEQNFDINYQLFNKKTVLHSALENNRIETARLVIEKNLNLSLDDAKEGFLHLIAKIGNRELFDDFLSKGFEIDKKNHLDETPLILALCNKHVDLAKFIISQGASVAAKCKWGTVLSEAISLDDEDILKLIFQKEPDVIKQKTPQGRTPLLSALTSCKLNAAKLILKFDPDVAMSTDAGVTPLHLAASNGYCDVVGALLEKNVEVDALTDRQKTPLLLALENNHCEVAQLLISRDANVLIEDKSKATPLHYAAEQGHLCLVKSFVEKGADVNKADQSSHTPLSLALNNAHFEVVDYLISTGGDLKVKLQRGGTCLQLAAATGNDGIIKECLSLNMDVNEKCKFGTSPLFKAISSNKIESAQLLIDNNADIYALDGFDNTILHLLAKIGKNELLFKMLELDFDIDALNVFHETPLCVALQRRNSTTVKLLLERGAKIDVICKNGSSVLHLAASGGYDELVLDCLKQTNCDVNKADNEGMTPLEYAISYGHIRSAEVLLENGAHVTVRYVHELFSVFLSKNESEEKLKKVLKTLEQILERCQNINAIGERGNTILHDVISSAVKTRLEGMPNFGEIFFEEVLKLLVHFGADSRIKNRKGKSSCDILCDDNLLHLLYIFNR